LKNDKIKIAFLDRDGVINKDVNYLYKIEDFEYTENCIEGLNNLQLLGFKIIIVTNQSGIGRGFYTEQQYQNLTDWYLADLSKYGVAILDVFHCPHHPEGTVPEYTLSCDCRKPSSGMFKQALSKYDIDIDNSLMVGDKESDLLAAQKAGIKNLILVESGHCLSLSDYNQYCVLENMHVLTLKLMKKNQC
jgi:D-glycero-D-manno-heptose 1,7-bisphosphate phosphatase